MNSKFFFCIGFFASNFVMTIDTKVLGNVNYYICSMNGSVKDVKTAPNKSYSVITTSSGEQMKYQAHPSRVISHISFLYQDQIDFTTITIQHKKSMVVIN